MMAIQHSKFHSCKHHGTHTCFDTLFNLHIHLYQNCSQFLPIVFKPIYKRRSGGTSSQRESNAPSAFAGDNNRSRSTSINQMHLSSDPSSFPRNSSSYSQTPPVERSASFSSASNNAGHSTNASKSVGGVWGGELRQRVLDSLFEHLVQYGDLQTVVVLRAVLGPRFKVESLITPQNYS